MATRKGAKGGDRRVVLWLVGGIAVLAVLFAAFGPQTDRNDPDPTTYNSSSAGIKASYLLLGDLGYRAERWSEPTSELANVDAANTTLVVTEPTLPFKGLEELQRQLAAFLKRGGRVITTGYNGARLLPGGETRQPSRIFDGLCYTTPEGAGAMATAGSVAIAERMAWSPADAKYRVEQRCGPDAVVVRYAVGEGEAIWWSSPMPMTNRGLSEDSSLKLLLAAVGPVGSEAGPRRVLFDEYLHTSSESFADTLKGLPWWSLGWELLAVAALLVLSRGRRNGPLRSPLRLPRNSPVEFAQSMGRLYDRAGATQAATEASRTRLLDYLGAQCGVPREVVREGGPGIGNALAERMGGNWHELEQHLAQAREAANGSLSRKSALALVKSLDADHERLRQAMKMQNQRVLVER